jgi:hypothetical protein
LLPSKQGNILVRQDLISHMDERGSLLRALAYPKETMLREDSPMNWDALRTAYFISHAIRHSLTSP